MIVWTIKDIVGATLFVTLVVIPLIVYLLFLAYVYLGEYVRRTKTRKHNKR